MTWISGSVWRSRSIAAGTRPASAVGSTSDPQPCAPARGGSGDLGARELEPPGDRVGMLKQGRALRGQREPAGAPLEQPRSELAFELGDLVGDRRLRQRELMGGAGERALVSDHAEGEHAPRVHSFTL